MSDATVNKEGIISTDEMLTPYQFEPEEEEFIESLVVNHGGARSLAEDLFFRIEEARDLNELIEQERERKADVTLEARIAELEAQLLAVNARLTEAVRVPSGWKLVPVKPTDEMEVAGQEAWMTKRAARVPFEECEEASAVYRAMLDSSPDAPKEETK